MFEKLKARAERLTKSAEMIAGALAGIHAEMVRFNERQDTLTSAQLAEAPKQKLGQPIDEYLREVDAWRRYQQAKNP